MIIVEKKELTPYEKQSPEERLKLEFKLKTLVSNGFDCIEVAQKLIKDTEAPFEIIKIEGEEKWELHSAYTNGQLWLKKFITIDKETIEMKSDAAKMADTQHEVLVYGETGTGKELIAKSQVSNRKGQIKCVNCAGFPRELIESELFGYVKGAFTGADKTRDGLIAEAKNGLMFMDEVGELPMDMQAKLLRVMQEKTIRKVGGVVEDRVECKFVFATNRDLKEMVKAGTFRQDLYARISTLELFIKPLRQRKDDLIPIVESLPGGRAFLDRYKDELLIGTFDMSLNVRSLQQLVIRFSVLGRLKI